MPSLRLRTLSAALAGTALACALAVSLASAQEKGGSLRLLARAAAGTIDPQINYTLQYWQLFYITYDGLVTFRKAGDATAFVDPALLTGIVAKAKAGFDADLAKQAR